MGFVHARSGRRRVIRFLRMEEWTWWSWAITVAVVIEGASGQEAGFVAALVGMAGQGCVLLVGERGGGACGLQLRAGYALLLLVCLLPGMRWMGWVPVVGVLAMAIFWGCLLARVVFATRVAAGAAAVKRG